MADLKKEDVGLLGALMALLICSRQHSEYFVSDGSLSRPPKSVLQTVFYSKAVLEASLPRVDSSDPATKHLTMYRLLIMSPSRSSSTQYMRITWESDSLTQSSKSLTKTK